MEMESKDITTSEIENERVPQINSFRSFRQEEDHWRLKSRSLWLNAGDRNTSFFHQQYKARLSRNHILKITSLDGMVCKGFDKLKVAEETYFENIYNEYGDGSEEVAFDFLSQIPFLVSREDNSALMKTFSEEEIWNVIWPMDQ